MPVKLFLRMTAAVTTGIGLTLLIFPSFVDRFFLPSSGHPADVFIRFLGSSLIGYTYLNWSTAKYDDFDFMHATLLGNFSTLLIALVISITAVLNHNLKVTGLLIVGLHLVFASGFGWYLYKSKPIEEAKAS